MNIKRINFIPHIDNFMKHYNLDNHNKARYVKSILEKKGKHYKNYNKYLIDNNITLYFEDLETLNQYKFTEYSIKNTQANYYKYQYNLKSLEEEYDDFKIVDYKTEAFNHFKMILNVNFIKFCSYVADGDINGRYALLYKGKYIFENLNSNIIDKILFNNVNIKEGIDNEIKSIYKEFLDKMNIEDDYILKPNVYQYFYSDKSIRSLKRNCKNIIKRDYILQDDIFDYRTPYDTNFIGNVCFHTDFYEWMLFMKIMNNNNNDKILRDNQHKEVVDINISKALLKEKESKKKIEKRHLKVRYRTWLNRLDSLEKIEIPKWTKQGNKEKINYCQERVYYYKNKISIYNKL